MAQKKKKTKRRKLTPIVRLLCLVMIGLSSFMLYQVGTEVLTTVRLSRELDQVKEKLQEVQDENMYLLEEQEKLQDPDYVENYARGNYMLSKDEEQIFYFPEDSDK